jgi:hypothetical protein
MRGIHLTCHVVAVHVNDGWRIALHPGNSFTLKANQPVQCATDVEAADFF